MDQEIKARWVEALRSGKYQQGTGRLQNPHDNSFCCLGVLCDLHSKETGEEWHFNESGYYLYLNSGGVLPEIVMFWANLEDRNPKVTFEKMTMSLVSWNDCGHNFEVIAAAIEGSL